MISLAAFSIILEPVAPEPVNDIILTLGCSLNGLPTPSPSPLTKLNTPLGTPAFQRFQLKLLQQMVFLQKVLTQLDYLQQMLLLI